MYYKEIIIKTYQEKAGMLRAGKDILLTISSTIR